MTDRIESVIFEALLGDLEFARKVLPFIQEEYFDSRVDRILFKEINRFFTEHNSTPTKKILKLFVDDCKDLKQDEFDVAIETINSINEPEKNRDWLVQRTEKFCRDKAIYNSIMTSISIMDGRNTKFNREAIPSLLSEALAVSFDKSVGHDYFDDAERRYDFYHLKEDRLKFDLSMFNKITHGGLPKKTLSCVVAGVNTGKSLALCHMAASTIAQGKNALYVTLEMSEERIAERIDCNLLNIPITELYKTDKTTFQSKLNDVKSKSHGRLIVKEYPTGGAHVGHFKSLLDELELKRNFRPDIVFVDYLNICNSQRLKGGSFNSYTIVKSIAEELRGLAVEYDIPIVTATQFTRSASTDTDGDMTGIAESFGTAATMDFIFALVRTEELDQMGQIMVKQLKSRFGDVNYYRRFVIGVDISKFKLYDVDNPTADLVDTGRTDEIPVFDKSSFGTAMKQRGDYQELDFS
jgi:archaellum biogenesis ATPase FlaH